MTLRLHGSRSRRAVALGLFCAGYFAVAVPTNLFAQHAIVATPYHGTDAASVPNPFRGIDPTLSGNDAGPATYGDPYDGGYGASNSCCEGGPCEQYEPYPAYSSSSHQSRISAWFGVEYLGWSLDGNELPPLVTASPATTPIADAAQLDDPNTVVFSGDQTVNATWRSGTRLSGGFWLDPCQKFGIGADYFTLGDDNYDFVSPQDASIITGRPFFNTRTNADDAELVSVPNQSNGIVVVSASDDFWGAGVTLNRRLSFSQDPYWVRGYTSLSGLAGFRHYEYSSSLSIDENLTVLPGTTTQRAPGTTVHIQDDFRTNNQFDGGEFGLQACRSRGWWWCDGLAKVALGRNRRMVYINGQTVTTVPNGGTTTSAGGLLTSEVTNIGTRSDSEFALIPEFRLGMGVNVMKSVSVWFGYNVIIWGDAACAASELPPDLRVDRFNLPPVQAGGGADPLFPGIPDSQLVAHGIDFNLKWQW